MDSKLHSYTNIRNAVHRMLEGSNVARGSNTEHSLSILEQKWNTVYTKMQDRKVIEQDQISISFILSLKNV